MDGNPDYQLGRRKHLYFRRILAKRDQRSHRRGSYLLPRQREKHPMTPDQIFTAVIFGIMMVYLLVLIKVCQ